MSQHHASRIGFEAAGTVGMGLALGHFALQDAMRDVRPGQSVPLRLPDLEVLSGVLGTPRFMAPEIVRGDEQDRLGAVDVHLVLAGRFRALLALFAKVASVGCLTSLGRHSERGRHASLGRFL